MISKLLPRRDSHDRVEPLEQRIAPALAISNVVAAVVGSPIVLDAGDMLSTSAAGGAFLLFVEKGNAIVYTTDLNNNAQVDFNEITGISAGDGLRLISFVDIHGSIVGNLRSDGQRLTDSDNDASNGFDGRVLLNTQIEKIELRSLTQEDIGPTGDLLDRLALSSYSIFGNIYAGRGFGDGTANGGLIIDNIGVPLQQAKFTGGTGFSKFIDVPPSIGSIKVGTAASRELFSFGTSPAGRGLGFAGEDIQGALIDFRIPAGQDGGDITGVRIANGTTKFNLGNLEAGDGGFNGRGGNISTVDVTGDMAGGYSLIAGNAGEGTVGKQGGSILAFTDKGSITSLVVLQSGDGGRGLLGAGGPGGTIEFSSTLPTAIAGRLFINLGDGGDGLAAGGKGADQEVGIFLPTEPAITSGLNIVSSTRQMGDIFNTISTVTDENGDVTILPLTDPTYHAIRGFDFDRDGINDSVYTSQDPDQVVVLFGHPFGGWDVEGNRYPGAPPTLYLNSPPNAEALFVADYNGDGLADIASASQDNSFAGVSVYLSQYTTDPATGRPSTFLGFSDPIQSAMPHVANYSDNLGNSYFQAPFKITNLTAGDYDGDGVMDLGLNTIQQIINSGEEQAVVFIMRGDSDPITAPKGTGFFFADFVNGGLPYDDGFHGTLPPYNGLVVLKSSALVDGGRDFLFSAAIDRQEVHLYDYELFDASVTTKIGLGKVDTNRDVSDPDRRDRISEEDARVKDFTLLDLNSDSFADLAVITSTPSNFLVIAQGDGEPGGFIIASNDPADDTAGRGGENSGIPLSEATPQGLGFPDTLVGILTTASDDGLGNDVAIVDYNRDNGHNVGFKEVTFTNFFTAVAGPVDGTSVTTLPLDQTILGFDTYRPDEASTTLVGYALVDAGASRLQVTLGTLPETLPPPGTPLGFALVPQANNGFFFDAGDGGDSANGQGGAGGQIGDKLVDTAGVITGTISIQLPALDEFAPTVRFIAGAGGNGYTAGGAGGDIQGVTLTSLAQPLTSAALLFGGPGGSSVKGTGGRGGNLDALSIVTGEVFIAGAGGRGVTGGAGGNVIGNKIAGLPDTTNSETGVLAVQGGQGGIGVKRGGNGGSITNFTPDFLAFVGGEVQSLFHYKGGDGGNALSGAGGKGGSIVNSSPTGEQNNVIADIELIGGRGGNGLTGGNGGDITDFTNIPGTGSLPLSVSVLAGYGGIGTKGKGGSGGNVRDINVTARGTGFQWMLDFSDPDSIEFFPGIPVTPISFGRYIAGEGAVSYGSTGGSGGSVIATTGIAAAASFAVVGGKGGDGLRDGGNGGDVQGGTTPSIINASPSLGSKVLLIAGDGGDVFGAEPIVNDPLAYGGTNGNAGGGGSVVNIRQDASQLTAVDIIAGNGGNTVNFGSSLDTSTKAGRGGSIRTVDVAGSIGSIATTVAIQAYNDISAGESVADFVTNTLINGAFVPLDDALGNVGIVAGSTGRVKDNNNDGILDPASVGANGSVEDVVATHIVSAVAGSVDRIASIQSLINVRVRAEGNVFGGDKAAPDPATAGQRDYLDENGNLIQAPVLGGELLDGAIIAKNDRALRSVRDFVRR